MIVVLNTKTKDRVNCEFNVVKSLWLCGGNGPYKCKSVIQKTSRTKRRLCYSITTYIDANGIEFHVYASDHADALKFLNRKVARDGNVTLARLAKP